MYKENEIRVTVQSHNIIPSFDLFVVPDASQQGHSICGTDLGQNRMQTVCGISTASIQCPYAHADHYAMNHMYSLVKTGGGHY